MEHIKIQIEEIKIYNKIKELISIISKIKPIPFNYEIKKITRACILKNTIKEDDFFSKFHRDIDSK
jgi:hypothetical protein